MLSEIAMIRQKSLCFFALILLAFGSATAQPKTHQLDRYIQQYHNHHLFNGNVLVIEKGNTIFSKSYGLASLEWNKAHQADSKFRIGSITKQFTALLIMQLKQQGKLELQHKITHYLPWYPKEIGDKITIHHLLTHSSGLINYTNNAAAIDDINTHPYLPEEIARKYCVSPLEFEPGTQFRYCNTGYYLLGVIIETLTRKKYADVLCENILQPAGMTHSGMDSPEAILTNRADGYSYTFDGYAHASYINPATATFSAGGMYSTVGDLYLWQKALSEDKLVSKENKAILLTPNRGNYGYGFYISRLQSGEPGQVATVIGHNGSISGFSSSMLRYLDDDILVILLDNTRAERRGNLENITLGIVNILHNKPVASLVESMQVALTERVNKSSGADLVAFYKTMKANKSDYDVSRAESILIDLGTYLAQQGRIKDGHIVLKFTTEEFPSSSVCYSAYAEMLAKEGQLSEAKAMYQRALELNPANQEAATQLKALQP
jgi:CubicO group peptidase (beta-lactamase class C family)